MSRKRASLSRSHHTFGFHHILSEEDTMVLMDQACLDLVMLDERYLAQQFVARGGMAMIYQGWDRQKNCTVALKIVHETNNTSFPYAEYLFHGACILSSLHHPHIVQMYDKGQQGALSFIVLDFIEGTSLYYEMQVQRFFSVKRALTLALAIALALGSAHRCGIVHLDVKPLNIMLGQNGERKLIDFGIARRYRETQGSAWADQDIVLGTPQYLAPEQALGLPVSPATDVYTLGLVLYEMLLGQRPFLRERVKGIAHQSWNISSQPRTFAASSRS